MMSIGNQHKKIQFGWQLPTGKQRMPPVGIVYATHVRQILDLIHGRFHSAWMPDHLMDGQKEIPEALETLSYLAGLYPQLHFGTVVLAHSYRNPALLAKMAATLQQLSGSRFIMGIGAGWKADEYHAYGYEFPRAATRVGQLAEVVQICKALWDPKQSTATFDGRYYKIDNAVCQPKPDLAPPIMIGGGGEKLTLRVVAEHADWWNLPGATAQEYARKLNILNRYCREIGRDPAGIRKTWMGVASIVESRSKAEEQLENYPIWPGDVPLVGTPADIRRQLQAYIELGVDLFILAFADEPRPAGINLFIDHVIN
jgi:alkanesulfonate monooxygenase SsuD/methylene tetrahydromethanopterin reductase-like flavin-dependent oxidoreductase (luciferase family)